MKIVTWNCNMAFRKKAKYILEYKPDILIVPECECPDKLKFFDSIETPTSIIWEGENLNKGLGVFSFGNYKLKLKETHNPNFKTILPVSVESDLIKFSLFAVWANNPKDPDGCYVTQVWKAVNYYNEILLNNTCVLAGDFNSNSIWDKPKRLINHSSVVNHLASKNIISTYHDFNNQPHGKEKKPTMYLYRHKEKSYHLDYCFTSQNLLDKVTKVQVGTHKKWSKLSDHSPIIVSFDL